MPFKQLIILMLAVTSCVACGQPLVDPAEMDELYHAEDEDPDMREAFRQARQGLDGFLAIWRNPPTDTTGFSVKVGIKEGENTEYFWISPFQEEPGGFKGTVNNEPRMVHSVQLGGEITFAKTEIVDWLYNKQNKMVGNYTACAMLNKEPESERLAFEQRFGLRCGA